MSAPTLIKGFYPNQNGLRDINCQSRVLLNYKMKSSVLDLANFWNLKKQHWIQTLVHYLPVLEVNLGLGT